MVFTIIRPVIFDVSEKPSSTGATVCRVCIERIGQISSDKFADFTGTQVFHYISIFSVSKVRLG